MLEEAPPRGLGERLLALGRFMRLAPLPTSQLARLARLSQERDLPAGSLLAAAGEPVRVVRFVVSGRIVLLRQGVEFMSVEAPDTVGLLPVAAAIPSPYEARAAEAVHCLDVDADILTELLEDDFEFFLRTLRQGAGAVLRRWRSEPRPAIALPPDDGSPALGPAERLLALRETELFSRSPVDGLAAFAKRLEETRVPAGGSLTARPGELVVVVRGRLTGEINALSGGAVLGAVEGLAERGSGFVLGAATSLRVLRGTTSDLLDTLEDHHAMGRRLLAELLTLLVAA